MLVELTHPELTYIHHSGVFNNVRTVQQLCNAITAHSLHEPPDNSSDPDADPTRFQKKFRGDAFEIFGEFFCKNYNNDPRIGVRDCEVVPLGDDVGVDLHGVSTMGDGPVTVQFKFRADPTYVFKLHELATWLAASSHIYGATGRNLILITTGLGVNYKIDRVNKDIRVVNREALRSITDKNEGFWNDFQESMKQSLIKPKERSTRTLYTDQEQALVEISKWVEA